MAFSKLIKEALVNLEKIQDEDENRYYLLLSITPEGQRFQCLIDGYKFCSCCGYLHPITKEEKSYYTKIGVPKDILTIKKWNS